MTEEQRLQDLLARLAQLDRETQRDIVKLLESIIRFAERVQ